MCPQDSGDSVCSLSTENIQESPKHVATKILMEIMFIKQLSDSNGYSLLTLAKLGRLFLFFQWLPKGQFGRSLLNIIVCLYVWLHNCNLYRTKKLPDIFWRSYFFQARSVFLTYSVVIYLITVSDIMWW